MSGWCCPHQIDGLCMKVNEIKCDPGMKGCVLHGRFLWANQDKNKKKKGDK